MKNKVMVIGGINADITGFSNERMVANDSNPGRIEISAGGVGRNIGENLARIGFSVSMLTVFARDAMGIFLMDHCKKTGIDVAGSPVVGDGARSSIYLSAVDSDGEMATAVSDMEILARLTPDDMDGCSAILEDADYIVVDSNISSEMIGRAMKKYGDGRIVVDPVSTCKARKLKGLDWSAEILKPNMLEAEILAEMRMDSRERIVEGMKRINSRGVKWVLLSDGGNGAWLSGCGRVFFCPSFKGEKRNVNGAGDAFLAGAVYGHRKQAVETDMLYYGHAAASIAMESEKTVNPHIDAQVLEDRTEELKRCLKMEKL